MSQAVDLGIVKPAGPAQEEPPSNHRNEELAYLHTETLSPAMSEPLCDEKTQSSKDSCGSSNREMGCRKPMQSDERVSQDSTGQHEAPAEQSAIGAIDQRAVPQAEHAARDW